MSAIGPTPNQSAIQTALKAFLQDILPDGMEVFEGQDNRVPEPAAVDFAQFTIVQRLRLRTNVDDPEDCVFTGSIAGRTMTVTAMRPGTNPIAVGRKVFGVGIAAGTKVASFGTGTGGVGTYGLSGILQTISSETISAGVDRDEQGTELVFQIDVHGPNASDNAQMISTLFRDEYAVQFFEDEGPDGVAPLYADDPKQIPFLNAEQQYEYRWVVAAHLQANQAASVALQFADELDPTLVNVEATYPIP